MVKEAINRETNFVFMFMYLNENHHKKKTLLFINLEARQQTFPI